VTDVVVVGVLVVDCVITVIVAELPARTVKLLGVMVTLNCCA